MVVEKIDPKTASLRLAELLGEDDMFAQAAPPVASVQNVQGPDTSLTATKAQLSGNAFEDILSKAIESLNGVSKSELYANQMIEKYARGQADLQAVMIAQSKMSVLSQLAVTTVNAAANTFKEITQIQI